MIKFVEVVGDTDFRPPAALGGHPRFSLEELWLNPDAVVKVQSARAYKQILLDGRMPTELDKNHSFTSITLNNGGLLETHVVLGAPDAVATKLNRTTKVLLKG